MLFTENELLFIKSYMVANNGSTVLIPEGVSLERTQELIKMILKGEIDMSSAEACVREGQELTPRPSVPHYQEGDIEPIDYINANNLNFNLGNVVKYITRAGKKEGENPMTDLKKAMDYLMFEQQRINNKGDI